MDNLTSCPDCGREISKDAATCPHCGKRIKEEGVDAVFQYGGAVIAIALIAAFVIWFVSTIVGCVGLVF